MTEQELKELSNTELLELYNDFIRWCHYEAVNEFDYLRDMKISRYEVHAEVKRRMGL
jgi:uncharacterized protein YjiS (DUF1127 family)